MAKASKVTKSEKLHTEPTKIPGRIIDLKEDNSIDVDWAAASKGFGSMDVNFLAGVSSQLANLGSDPSRLDANAVAFLASIVAGVAPRDTTEALLATQMAAIHNSVILMTTRLTRARTIAEQDSAERALNKLARTFALQVEGLARYRNGGRPKVVVEHVTVAGGDYLMDNTVEQKPEPVQEQLPELN